MARKELPIYVNKQRAYTNTYGSTIRITAIQDENYVVSIESESGTYNSIYVPGDILENMMLAFINEPKSALAEAPRVYDEIDVWDQIKSNDINKGVITSIVEGATNGIDR